MHKTNSVTTSINVGTNLTEKSLLCIELAIHFANCYATIWLHPNYTTVEWNKTIQELKRLCKKKKISKLYALESVVLNNISYPNYNLKQQQEAFHAQINLALEHNLALVMSFRDEYEETYQALAQYRGEKNFRGTIHCFSSDELYVQKYIDLEFCSRIWWNCNLP